MYNIQAKTKLRLYITHTRRYNFLAPAESMFRGWKKYISSNLQQKQNSSIVYNQYWIFFVSSLIVFVNDEHFANLYQFEVFVGQIFGPLKISELQILFYVKIFQNHSRYDILPNSTSESSCKIIFKFWFCLIKSTITFIFKQTFRHLYCIIHPAKIYIIRNDIFGIIEVFVYIVVGYCNYCDCIWFLKNLYTRYMKIHKNTKYLRFILSYSFILILQKKITFKYGLILTLTKIKWWALNT